MMQGVRNVAGRVTEWWTNRKRFAGTDRTPHTLYFQGQRASAVLTVATTPVPVNTFLQNVRSIATSASVEPAVRTNYQSAVTLAREIDGVRARVESGPSPRQPADIDDLNQRMERLAALLPPLISLSSPSATVAGPGQSAPVAVNDLIKITRSNLIAVVSEVTPLLVRYRYIRPRQRLTGPEGLSHNLFGTAFVRHVDDPRELYLGPTPRKTSAVGSLVKQRMQREGKVRVLNNVEQILHSGTSRWYNVAECDMGHVIDAVTWWNSNGRLTGAQSAAVIAFMNDPDNYEFEPSDINRARGAGLGARGIRYLPPAV
jgi:hypothetical protein